MSSDSISSSGGPFVSNGPRIPDDIKQKMDRYNERISKQNDKANSDATLAGQYYSQYQAALKNNDSSDFVANLQASYSKANAALIQDVGVLTQMQDNAYRDVINSWAQELKQQGVDVPDDLGSGDEALQKLASLQYTVDLQKVGADAAGDYTGSITAQIMLANIGRTQLLDNQLSDQLKDLQDKNKLLAEANKVMSDLRAARPADSDDDAKVPSGVVQWARDNGVSIPGDVAAGKSVKQAVWDQFIQNIKSFVDTNNNDSQLMMVRLQDIQQKRDNAFELVSDLIKKLGQVDEQIIQGMG